jgi:hypothetical protein
VNSNARNGPRNRAGSWYITRDERFCDIVGIDEGEEFVVGLLWYGYPKITPEQKRTALDAVLSELP